MGDPDGFDCPRHGKFKVAGTIWSLARTESLTEAEWESALAKAKARTKPGELPSITSYDLP